MDRGEALSNAVINAPDDDAPRLDFADWLDSIGNVERAEFIRVQCMLHSEEMSDERRCELEKREKHLLERHGWDWAEEFKSEITEWVFVRGFIERVRTRLGRSRKLALNVLDKAPIRHLRDDQQIGDLRGFVDALPRLDRLTGLEFWNLYRFDHERIRDILQSPHLQNLKCLILHHDRNGFLVADDVLIEGLHSPYRSNIEELAVCVDSTWGGPSNEVIDAIAESDHLRNLRHLNLTNAGDSGNEPILTAESIRKLAASPNLKHLEILDLRLTHATADVWDAILQMPQLRQLKKLFLESACEIPKRGKVTPIVGYIANIPHWREAFEQVVTDIDWNTDLIEPIAGSSWVGMSWDDRCKRFWFEMATFARNRDWDGLEARYRQICKDYADDETIKQAAELSFTDWRDTMREGLQLAVETTSQRSSDTIFLRLRTDDDWSGQFDIHDRYGPSGITHEPVDPDEPFEEFSHQGPEAFIKIADFKEAGDMFRANWRGDSPGPIGIPMFLVARTVAEFGRCLDQLEFPQQVFFGHVLAAFRMKHSDSHGQTYPSHSNASARGSAEVQFKSVDSSE